MKIYDLAEGITKGLVLGTAATVTTATCQTRCTGEIFDCLANAKVPFLRDTDAAWNDYAYTYNVRLPCQPLVVALPDTAAQVADAVVCAGRHGLPVQAKSGGHSYASFSNGGTDGAVVIHLRNLRDVEVDGATGIARVGGGVRLGPLSLAIYGEDTDGAGARDNSTKRALAHGTCPAVGIGGHYTHGGYGHFSRAWGLALDQIVAMDVVLANGTIVHASREKHQDIFFVWITLIFLLFPIVFQDSI
jgi:FAD/FMN-containing dehydrogenase